MKYSYSELKNLGFNHKQEEIEKRMFQLGHEVEEVIDYNIDNLVVGQILHIKPHPDADKLNICQVDLGDQHTQIVCGAPNVKKDMKVLVAKVGAKLGDLTIEPRTIRGIESLGMMCSLEELGINKELLTDDDCNGIAELPNAEIGTNPLEYLGLNDQMLDVFLTANRGDCQSYRGIYNDLLALDKYNHREHNGSLASFEEIIDLESTPDIQYLNKKNYNIENQEIINNDYEIEVDNQYVDYFSVQKIQNIQVQESDLQKRIFLIKHGIKAQNNITDISNELLLKLGIPTHIYDADKISGKIQVGLTQKEEEFHGLDDKKIIIPAGILVIKDSQKIIAIAGVMGSYETRITTETKNILIEVASFDSHKVFQSSKLIGKKTESAQRYEKKIDINILTQINTLIIEKVYETNKNISITPINVHQNKIEQPKEVKLNYKMINKILGIEIPKTDIIFILKSLKFTIKNYDEYLMATIPSFRKDIEQENDLIEEVIRIYGIDKIQEKETLSNFSLKNKIINDNKDKNIKKIENILLNNGLNEVLTYSLVSEKQIQEINGNKDKAVKLLSPLSKEHEYYRQSLIPSLIDICQNNFSYQEKQIKIFEVANTYQLEKEMIKENTKISALISGAKENVFQGVKSQYNFYDLKNILENLFAELNLKFDIKPTDQIKELNPYASGEIILNNQKIGIIGEVVFDYYKKMRNKIYVFEIDYNAIINGLEKQKQFKKISTYPSIERDLTIDVPNGTLYIDVVKAFEDINYLTNYYLSDIYIDPNDKEQIQKMTFKLEFQNEENTLLGEDINQETIKIIDKAQSLGFTVKQ